MVIVPTKETVKRRTIRDMKALGVHKPEYNRVVDIYAGLVNQYFTALAEFEEGGCQYEVMTGQGGTKKSPMVATLENLRKDILAYSDRLCLNPKSFEALKVEQPKRQSALAKAVAAFEGS